MRFDKFGRLDGMRSLFHQVVLSEMDSEFNKVMPLISQTISSLIDVLAFTKRKEFRWLDLAKWGCLFVDLDGGMYSVRESLLS